MVVRGYVKLAVVFLFMGFGLSVFADDPTTPNNPAPLKTSSTSKEVMLESMNDPIAHKAFHDIQLQLLQTAPDALIYNFFSQSEVFRPLYQFLVKNNEAILAGFEMHAKTNMLQVAKGLRHKHSYIDNLVVQVASNLGFTKEAIENRQIFILGGEENAFTVSGSQKKIIVAFQRGILERLSRQEIAAVLAHELGHIRAEHTVKGIMNSIMLEITGELFVNGRLSVSQSPNQFKIANDACIGACSHSKKIFENQQTQQSLTLENEKTTFINEQIQKFVMDVASMPKAQLEATVGGYLYTMLQVAEAENAPKSTIRYLNTLLQHIGNIGTFKVNMQEFVAHAKMIDFAVSRAKEKTADQISASIIRNEYLAASFSKMLGLDFDKEYRADIFEQIKKQAQEILTTVPAEQLSSYVGTTHPSLVLRVNTMLTIPSYPAILFANNFLRLLLLNDALVEAKESAKVSHENFKIRAERINKNFETVMAENIAKGMSADEVKKLREINSQEFKKLNARSEGYVKATDESHANHEKRLLELLFSKEHPVSGERAPRMDNTIQYLSVRRETSYLTIAYVKEQIEKIKADPASTAQNQKALLTLEQTVEKLTKDLENQRIFIEKIRIRLKNLADSTKDKRAQHNLNKRSMFLSRVLTANTSLDLEKIRSRVTSTRGGAENSDYRRNKIPVKLNTLAPVASPGYSGSVCSSLFGGILK